MNLGDMAEQICKESRHNDATGLDMAKRFLRRRYEDICSNGLWRDLIYQLDINVAVTGTADAYNSTIFNSLGYYLFPKLVDRIIAVRTTDNALQVESSERLFQITPDQFEQSGNPVNFQIVSPRAWMFGTSPLTGLGVSSTDAATDPGARVEVDVINAGGRSRISTIVNPDTSFEATVIERVSKVTTSGSVSIFWIDGDGVHTACTMGPTETNFGPLPTIRLTPKPTADIAYKVLIKKQPLPFLWDYDEPDLRGVSNCLMKLAQADLLKWLRRVGQAQEPMQEGMALLKQLQEECVYQEASRTRFVPDTGDSSDPNGYPFESKYGY